ncbi:MAG: MFS transporter, partial [Firmicutes bacterium]|nr:MFS transporter [Bacillota bacterium]
MEEQKEEVKQKKKSLFKVSGVVPFGERMSYWSYGAGMLIFYQIVASFLNTFIIFQGVNMAKVAVILLIVKVWDAVNDPLFAFIFDRIKFKKEKCMPWLRLSAILMPFVSIAFFHMPHDWTEGGKLAWFAITYVLWDFCFTINDIPFYSMSTTMTIDTHERDTIYNIARVFNGGGYFFVQIVMTWLIGEAVGMSFAKASLIVCLVGIPFIIPLCFVGKERYAVTEKSKQAEKYTLKQMWTFLKGNKYLL